MAKNKRSRAAAFANGNVQQGQPHPKSCHKGGGSVMLTQDAIDRHWKTFPPQAKSFILNTPNGRYSLPKLVNFWSQPQNVHCTQGGIAGSLCSALWYLALVYLRMGLLREARALTVNGSFIHQCFKSSLEDFKRVLQEPAEFYNQKLPYFFRGFNSIGSPQQMESYIRYYVPKEYFQMMTSYANLSNASSMMGYINQISDDWNGSPSKSHQPLRSNNDGETIKITIEDDSNNDETCSFEICSSTTLKALFNDYADYRGISLRSLRFLYAGKTLFLSNAGHKTPEQMGMKDQDVIKVHDSSTGHESSSGQAGACKSTASKKNKAKKHANRKTKGKGRRRKQCKEPARSLGDNHNATQTEEADTDQSEANHLAFSPNDGEQATPPTAIAPAYDFIDPACLWTPGSDPPAAAPIGDDHNTYPGTQQQHQCTHHQQQQQYQQQHPWLNLAVFASTTLLA